MIDGLSLGFCFDRTLPPPFVLEVAGRLEAMGADSLWVIEATRLGRPASNDQVAVAWPRWYAANRVEIGSDPSLIRPGQILHTPRPAEGPR